MWPPDRETIELTVAEVDRLVQGKEAEIMAV